MSRHGIDFQVIRALLFGICLVLPTVAATTPEPCAVDSGVSNCSVVAGDSGLFVRASSLLGGEFLATATTGGVIQLGLQSFAVYSFDADEYIDVTLNSATQDAATRTIEVQFTETFSSAIRATAIFTLSDVGDTTVIDQSFTFLSLVPLGSSASGRFYIVTDYDLKGDFIDETVNASPGGLTITQTDGSTTATQEVLGPVPDAFDIGVFPELSGPILNDVFVNLPGRSTAAGPDDFQHALSWDRDLFSGTSITVTIQQTITTVPEPAGASATALLTLAMIAQRRKGG